MTPASRIDFSYKIERTRRRTVAIYIDPARGVLVRAPKRVRDSEIEEFILKKSRWITGKLAEVQKRAADIPCHTYSDGDVFHYLGDGYVLRICEGKRGASIVGREIMLCLKPGDPPESLRQTLKKWYSDMAREKFSERVTYYSNAIGVQPNRIAVRNQARRWGSCSGKGNVNLNLKLIMAPPGILDYVVAHELCHLRHPNHSPEFWNLLAKTVPDFAERRRWLKENGHKFVL